MKGGMTQENAAAIRLAVGGLLALATAMGIGRFALTPILPFMSDGIPLTAAKGGAIASANFFGYLIGALAAMSVRGVWIARVFSGSLIVSVASTIAMSASSELLFLTVLRFIGGLASAGVLVLASTLLLERLAASGRSGLGALHFSGVGMGIALSAVVVGAIAVDPAAWRGLWIAVGAAAAACAAAAAICLWPVLRGSGEAAGNESVPPRTGFGFLRVAPALKRLAFAYGLFGAGYVVTATFLTSILRASETIARFEAPVWAAVGATAAISVAVWTRLAARFGTRLAFAWACILEAVGVAASVLVPGLAGPVLGAVLLGGTFMGITALGLIEARRLSPAAPALVLGLMTACFGLGQAVGPLLAGLVADISGGFLWPSLGAAALRVAAALLGGTHRDTAE